ncbi:MAG: tetratricopeptide repeat protein [Phycisphaeraceae bacterium]|nr:tetratricopeptide repeat protein [Phycisphaeraceae bacterium]
MLVESSTDNANRVLTRLISELREARVGLVCYEPSLNEAQDLPDLIHCWMRCLGRHGANDDGVADFNSTVHDLERFWSRLNRVAAAGPVYLIAPNLHQLQATPLTELWDWLPPILPDGVVFLGTSRFGRRINRLFDRPDCRRLRLAELPHSDARLGEDSNGATAPVMKAGQSTLDSLLDRIETSVLAVERSEAWITVLIRDQYRGHKGGLDAAMGLIRRASNLQAILRLGRDLLAGLERCPLVVRAEVAGPVLERMIWALKSMAEKENRTDDAVESLHLAMVDRLGTVWCGMGQHSAAQQLWREELERQRPGIIGLLRSRHAESDFGRVGQTMIEWLGHVLDLAPGIVDVLRLSPSDIAISESIRDDSLSALRLRWAASPGWLGADLEPWRDALMRWLERVSPDDGAMGWVRRLFVVLLGDTNLTFEPDWCDRILEPAVSRLEASVRVPNVEVLLILTRSWKKLAERRREFQQYADADAAIDRAWRFLDQVRRLAPWRLEGYERELELRILRSQLLLTAGSLAESGEEAQRGIARAEQLCRLRPTDSVWPALVSQARVAAGEVLSRRGMADAALAEFRCGLALHEGSGAERADEHAGAWARSLYRYGDALLTHGDAAAALAAYRQSLMQAQAYARRRPGNPRPRWMVAIIRAKIGDALRLQNQPSGAEGEYRRALELLEELDQTISGHRSFHRDLAAVTQRLGVILQSRQPAEALELLERAYQMMPQASDSPAHTDQQRDRMAALHLIGRTHLIMGDAEAACLALGKAAAYSARLIGIDRGHMGWLEDHVRTLGCLAGAHREAGRLSEARCWLGRACDALRSWHLFQPNADRPNRLSCELQTGLADLDEQAGDPTGAVANLRLAEDAAERVLRIEPGDAAMASVHASLVRREAELLARLSRPDDAMQRLAGFLKDMENVYNGLPLVVRLSEAARTLDMAAEILTSVGEHEQAQFCRRESRKRMEMCPAA